MRLLYVLIIALLLTDCTVTQSYNECGIKTLIGNKYQSEKVSRKAYIEINTTFKLVRVKFAGKMFKYKIASYEYAYEDLAVHIKENRIGIDIISKMGHKLQVRWNKKGWVPYADLYYKQEDGTEVLVFFNYRE